MPNNRETDNFNEQPYIEVKLLKHVEIKKGQTFTISFGGVPVVPPYLMLESFIELPDFIELIKDEIHHSEGSYEDSFTLKANEVGQAIVRLGYRKLQDQQATHTSDILIVVEEEE